LLLKISNHINLLPRFSFLIVLVIEVRVQWFQQEEKTNWVEPQFKLWNTWISGVD